MDWFAVFAEKYLQSHGCRGINFTATVDCTNSKTEIQIEIIETQITGIQLYPVIKSISPFSDKLAYSQLINWLTYRFSTAQTSLITNTLKKWWCTKAYWKHWRLTFIYDSFFAINISRLSLFWFHKQPWSMFWKIIVFLQFSKIVGDN